MEGGGGHIVARSLSSHHVTFLAAERILQFGGGGGRARERERHARGTDLEKEKKKAVAQLFCNEEPMWE